jgi:Activator of Hsp90 ATPase homolog 1-like protein
MANIFRQKQRSLPIEIDIERIFGAVKREVSAREREGRTARVANVARTYDTHVEDLWDALTNHERIPRWFLPVSGDLRLGGRYQLEGNASGTITACEPPRHLAATWEYGDEVSG